MKKDKEMRKKKLFVIAFLVMLACVGVAYLIFFYFLIFPKQIVEKWY